VTHPSKPSVSVVTPVYNGDAYLAECIESVLAQTYNYWDYTIVNNCSTDRSSEIAHYYSRKDSRIRVVDQSQLLRAIPNHNRTLCQISPASKYCKMVFADDWMFPRCLEEMVAVGEEDPTIGIIGAYGLQGSKVVWQGLPYPSRVVAGRDVCRLRFLNGHYVFGTATSLLYRSDIVRSRRHFYNEANLHADSEVCFDLLRTCNFGFVHQVLTFTRERNESLRTFTQDTNTLIAGVLHEILTYGAYYLDERELKICLNRHLSAYYDFLASSLLRGGRDRQFWSYHKLKLMESGVRLDYRRLARRTLARIGSAALNPKFTIEELVKVSKSGGISRVLRKLFLMNPRTKSQSFRFSASVQGDATSESSKH